MRDWYRGCALAFQAKEIGSNPIFRSKKKSYERGRHPLDVMFVLNKDYIMKVNITHTKTPKVVVNISNDDVWNMDVTLAYVIHPMLLKYQERSQGSFNVDDEDVPEAIRSTAAGPKEYEYETDEFHAARHDYVINEMIWAFNNIIDDKSEDFWLEKPDPNNFLNTGKYDLEACADYEKRIMNGTRLFGKYYQSLWI